LGEVAVASVLIRWKVKAIYVENRNIYTAKIPRRYATGRGFYTIISFLSH